MFEINFIGLAISMVLLLAFMTPIILNVRKNNKTHKELLLRMNNAAIEHGMKIVKMDVWRNRYAIAIDPESSKLIYIDCGTNSEVQSISFAEMDIINIHESSHIVGSGKDSNKVIDNLDLIIQGSGNQKYKLCFYDGEVFSNIQNEKPLIEDYYNAIKTIMKNNSFIKKPVMA